MSLTQREAFARLMEHMCKHDGDGGHGYSQPNRMGNGTTETVDLGDGVTVTVAGGDRDCSSAIITCLRAAGVDTHNASYTGNMRAELLKTGLFEWQRMGVASAKRGDIYLNETHHTAMCTCADPDTLAQFSRSETHGISGKTGDQDGYESNIRAYYSYPWDGKLVWVSDGATLSGSTSGGSTSGGSTSDTGLGDTSWTGPKMLKEWQRQLGTSVDGKLSNQSAYVRKTVLVRVESGVFDGNTSGDGGSSMVKALQAKVGTGVDGSMGHGTVKALQTWLNSKLGACLDVDGYYGPATSRAVGTALDKGLFK